MAIKEHQTVVCTGLSSHYQSFGSKTLTETINTVFSMYKNSAMFKDRKIHKIKITPMKEGDTHA